MYTHARTHMCNATLKPARRGRIRTEVPAPDALQVHLLKRRGPPIDKPLILQARSARTQVQLASSQGYALDRTAALAQAA